MLNRFGSHFRHNVVAYLALFFALGGTAIAARPLITSADVQDGSLTGADVSDNSTLKGVEIDEADLGQVPSALNADFATNADKVDGLDASELGGGATTFEVAVPPHESDYRTVAALDNGVSVLAKQCDPGSSTDPADITFGLDPTSNPEDDYLQLSGFTLGTDETGFPEERLGFRQGDPSLGDPALEFGGLHAVSFHGLVRVLPGAEPDPGPWAHIDVTASVRPGFPDFMCTVSVIATPYG